VQTWERYRGNVLAFVDAVPPALLHFRPTAGVRNYAEQIEHVVLDNVVIAATAVRGQARPPTLGDKTVYLHDRAALAAYVDATFDYVLETLRGLDAAALEERVSLFGETEVTRREALAVALEHGAWTLGQLVPYLRLNGIDPPAYRLLP
ncbi:MAG TPA: DinB family protein, partial [Longimicrobiales bacterium]|nr:DinB family protein [Longimicrobiales bacterium]